MLFRSQIIGEYVMEGLRDLDEVSYIRFASVYKKFKDITTFFDFVNDFETILKEKNVVTKPSNMKAKSVPSKRIKN